MTEIYLIEIKSERRAFNKKIESLLDKDREYLRPLEVSQKEWDRYILLKYGHPD